MNSGERDAQRSPKMTELPPSCKLSNFGSILLAILCFFVLIGEKDRVALFLIKFHDWQQDTI